MSSPRLPSNGASCVYALDSECLGSDQSPPRHCCDWADWFVICGPAKEGRKKMKNDMEDEEGR